MGLWVVMLMSGAVFGGGCAIIASNKNRDPLGWFALGVLFSLVALIVIAALSPLEKAKPMKSVKAKKTNEFVSNPEDPERPWLG